MCTDAHRHQKTATGLSGTAITGGCKLFTWVLETKLESSGRTGSAFNSITISPAISTSSLGCRSGLPSDLVFPCYLPRNSTILARSTHFLAISLWGLPFTGKQIVTWCLCARCDGNPNHSPHFSIFWNLTLKMCWWVPPSDYLIHFKGYCSMFFLYKKGTCFKAFSYCLHC